MLSCIDLDLRLVFTNVATSGLLHKTFRHGEALSFDRDFHVGISKSLSLYI